MAKVERLCYVGLNASDLRAWSDFASHVLAMETVEGSSDDALILRMDDHHQRFIVQKSAEDDIAYAGWQVRNAAALRETVQVLTERGLQVTQGTAEECALRKVQGFSWFVDPHSGLRVELAFGPKICFQPPFKPARPLTGYKTGRLGLGHIAMYVPDLAAAENFYIDVLGFAVSDWATVPVAGNVVAFLHCNPRHHSLALLTHPAATRRLNHIALEVMSFDDLGRAMDICKERDLTIVQMGRHMNDHAISTYIRTPSGWAYEISCQAREIDPSSWCSEYYDIGVPHGGGYGHDGIENLL